ncbi:MAG: hypothetical protein PF489_14570 [Salinivirgaceae bacterium]|jgi:hypothetical protein|nr:hypothetical protein [Salinivirgaceae bacterium]
MDSRKIIIGVIFALFIIIVSKWNRDSKKDNVMKILEQGQCAIGYFTKAIKAGGAWPGYPDKSSYYFCIENDTMHDLNRNLYPPPEIEATIKKGDKFLVLYLEDDPRYSRIIFDYPIKDSSDFQDYKMSIDTIRSQVIKKWKESLDK